MKKRVTGLLLALCLCLTLLPGTAGAAEPATTTADFTSADSATTAIALLNQHKTGETVSTWNNSSKTLALNGINFTTTAQTAVKLPAGSTIVLADGTTNTIKGGDAEDNENGTYKTKIAVYGIYAQGALTIQGRGGLTVNSGSHTNSGDAWTYSTALYAGGDLTVKGGSVTATGGKATSADCAFSYGVGLAEGGDLTITGGSLTGIGGESVDTGDGEEHTSFSEGFDLYKGSVSVTGGKLEGKCVSDMDGEGLAYGIRINSGALTVSGGEVSADARNAIDISGGNLKLTGGMVTANSRDKYYGAVSVTTDMYDKGECGNIEIGGGNLAITGGVYMSQYDSKTQRQGLFTVTDGTVKTGQIYGAHEIAVNGGKVETGKVETDTLTLSNGTLQIREPVHEGGSGSLYASSAIVCNNSLTVNGGTLDAAWDWGQHKPIVFPVSEYWKYATPLVHTGDYRGNDGTATFAGGTTILNTGCAGNTALRVGELYLNSVKETGADTSVAGAHKQEYADTPVVFSNATRTPVTVSGVTAQDKTYDGTTAAELTAGSLTGVKTGDTVSLGSANVTANFKDADVGTDKPVTVTGGTFDLRGKDAYKYALSTQPTDLTNLTANITPYTDIKDATNKDQTIYVGGSSFAAPKFTGVTVGGVTETVTGDVAYKVGNDTKTVEKISTALKALKAGEKLTIGYTFTASGNYSGEKTGTITVTAQNRPAPGTSGSVRYDVTVAKAEHGTVSASAARAAAGDTVTLTVQPDSGYVLAALTVTDSQGQEVRLTRLDGGKYTFTMSGSRVEVKAAFAGITFSDVPGGAYYAAAVRWAVEKGVTNGTGDGTFQPNGSCTRAQLAAFLWRLAGEPEAARDLSFPDVRTDAWCAKALRWAAEQGIVTGYADGSFRPDQTVTRIQAVAMLYRYAKAQGMDTTQGGMAVREFDDFAAVPAYALEAAGWAVNAGILRGADNRLMPNAPCTRAQIVTFLCRAMRGK